jgi:hypothetical protein
MNVGDKVEVLTENGLEIGTLLGKRRQWNQNWLLVEVGGKQIWYYEPSVSPA